MAAKTSAPLPPQAGEDQHLQQVQQQQSPYAPYGAVAYQQPQFAPTGNVVHATIAPVAVSQDVVDEMQQRRRWKTRTIWCALLSIAFIALGASCIRMRDDGDTGACCLPRGCDVSLLNNDKFKRPAVGPNGRCTFTAAEMELMGCAAAFQRTSNCSISWVPKKHHNGHDDDDHHGSNPCTDRNPLKVGIVGTGVTLVVVGSLGVLYSVLFLYNGFECYGAQQEKRSCGNRCAMGATSLVWMTCIGGAITGIVFASILTYTVYNPFDAEPSCRVDDSSKPESEQKCKVGHWGKMWSGANCPVEGHPADVFTFSHPSGSMKAHAFFGLGYSIFFVIGSAVVLGWLVKTWCCARRPTPTADARQVVMPVYGIVTPAPQKEVV